MRESWRLWTGAATLGELPALLARRYGSRVAIEGPGQSWTFAALAAEIHDRAAAHAAADRSGRSVLLVWPNEAELLLELLALSHAGAIPAPVKARAHPDELAAVAEAVGAVDVVAPAGTSVQVPLWGGDVGDGPAAGRPGPDDVAVMLTTSGTTGRPKAARLTHRGLVGGLGWLSALPVGRTSWPRAHRDAVLSALPLAHVMGLATALAALCAGVPWVHRARFDAGEILDLIEARRPNVFVGVPTMYADLEAAGADDRDLSSVQLWVSGADAMPTDRARRFQARGGAIGVAGQPMGWALFGDAYGMVELSGPAAFRLLPSIPVPVAVPYRIRPGLSVRAVDAAGRRVFPGRRGVLQFRGSGVMHSYLGHKPKPGWMASGDVGRVLPGGLFLVEGRGGDRLKVGGFSVFPAEVEAALDGAPGVREVAVVGAADPRLGDRLVALVVADHGFDPDQFLAWARDRVSGYRRPTDVKVVHALPRGPNGKLDRKAATHLLTR